MSDEMDDLYDKYEAQRGGDFAPVVSWKKSDTGDGFTGILLPARPVERPDKGYEVRREYKQANPKEGQEAGFTVWPPRNNQEKIKRPVVESEFVTRWPDEDLSEARKVSQNHFTFETGLADGSLLSNQFKDRCAEQDPPVDPKAETRRRIIEQGESLTKGIEAALKKVGGKPLPGQIWTITLASKTPNEYGGETNGFTVAIERPTEATRQVVKEYVEAAKLAAAQAEDEGDPNDKYAGASAADDPWATHAAAKDAPAEEPPF